MNVYDFDNTILRGDSSARFFAWCLTHYPRMWRDLPGQALNGLLFALHVRPKQTFKQRMFHYFTLVDMDRALDAFWRANLPRVKAWYLEKHRDDDVVISASPEFLIRPACAALGIRTVMGSPVDRATGRYSGANCHGPEKVRRFRAAFPDAVIDDFYSDSHSDDPLAHIARRAWLVRGDRLLPWEG